MARVYANAPGVFRNVCTLFVVSVTRQKEAGKCSKYQEARNLFTELATYGSASLGRQYSSSYRRQIMDIHSCTAMGTGWCSKPQTQSPQQKSVGLAMGQ